MADRRSGVNLSAREREEYRARAVQMLVQGHTEREVAAELGISHSSVGRLWAKQREEWAEEHEALIERELEKLDVIEAEHWKAYAASRGECRTGEPEHLERVLTVMKERAARLGLYPPKRLMAAVAEQQTVTHVIRPAPGGDNVAYLHALQEVLDCTTRPL